MGRAGHHAEHRHERRRHAGLRPSHGREAADALYLRFVQGYATHVARLDPDMFDSGQTTGDSLRDALRHYEREMEEPFPEDPAQQLSEVLRSMARAWEGTSARLLRQAKGAPVDAALGLVVQEMAQGIGAGHFRLGRDPVRRSGDGPSRRSPGAIWAKARAATR